MQDTPLRASLPDFRKENRSAGETVCLCLLFLAATVYPPLLLSPLLPQAALMPLSVTVCLLSVLTQACLLKSGKEIFGHILLLLSVGLLSGSVHLAAALGSVMSAACSFCWLALSAPAPLALILPLLSYGAGAALSLSPMLGLLALAALPAAFLLTYGVRGLRSRVSTICLVSAGLLLSAAVGIFLWLLLTYRTLSFELISSLANGLREKAIALVAANMEMVESSLGLDLSAQDRQAMAEELIGTLFNLLPALLVILSNAVAFAIQSAMTRILYARKTPKELVAGMMIFDVSAVSSVIFFFCLFFSWMTNTPKTAMYSVAAQNLYLILVPAMLITAWMFLNVWLMSKKASCLTLILYPLILFLFFNFAPFLLPLGAAVGAALNLVAKIRRYLREKKS